MNTQQARERVAETFRQKFDDARFLYFIRNLVNHLDESKRQTWTLKKAAFEDYVNHFTRLGTYSDPDCDKVDVLVIYLRRETTLSRGRVTLRNFVADYLATGHGQGKAAVIAAFVSPHEDDWRFSFVKLDYTFEKTDVGLVAERRLLTPARRYSYLVGKNENCHTAQKQFIQLLKSDETNPTVAQLESAFSVEKVTREFYEQYKVLFEKTRDALAGFLNSASAIRKHFTERGIENDDFAKKLLGQIVFLYFLQKKGWFGVECGKPWGSGRKDFIRHLFTNRADYAHVPGQRKRPSNFFNDILEPQFYEALAAPRTDDDHYYSRFDCRIPFLNGGLFEPLYGYNWVETDILLPDTLFSNDEQTEEGDNGTGILDVFDRYNFTVNEAEPLEKEVAVDPEMLGKVFENLLPENIRHSAGTYYTPRVIVHYMCQQALLNYLATRAPHVPQNDLVLFIRLAERFADFEAKDRKSYAEKGLLLPESISQNAGRLDDLLATITVCDPAIGSGAFPVGMMHEIVRARLALTWPLEKQGDIRAQKSRTAYALKRGAIHHSLYGVDIDPGAVEIAKLRLWLSMVVDEEEIRDIQQLPNLDYKIMQGNSLLEEFEGVRLFDERLLVQEKDGAINPRIVEIESRQRWVQREVNRLVPTGQLSRTMIKNLKDEAARLARELKTLKNPGTKAGADHPELTLGPRESLKRIQQLQADFFDEPSRIKKEQLREELNKLEWEFMRATLREQGREQALADLEKASAKHRKPFFLWWLHFSDIKQQRGGFDVVMANPPFVRMELIMHDKPALKRRFPYLFSGRADLYVYFYGLGLDILRDAGCLTFISSNTYLNSKFGEKLRTHFHENATVSTLIDFAETKVFDAVVEPAIIVLRKSKSETPVRILKWPENQPLDELQEVVVRQSGLVPQSSFTVEPWRLESPVLLHLLDHLQNERVSKPLGSYVDGDVLRGVVSGLNDAFMIDAATRAKLLEDPRSKEIIKPFVRGRDISRWTTQPITSWLIYTYHGIDISRYPLIEEHLFSYRKDLEDRATKQAWYELQQPQFRYSSLFEQPKIIYQDIARYFGMAWDDSGAYLANTCYFIPTPEKWLLGVLLSSTMQFYVQKTIGSDEGGFIRLFAMHVKKFPIPHADNAQKGTVERLVDRILAAKQRDAEADVSALEREIDELVYALYGLTAEEKALVQAVAK
jgi:type I restriction-modification system DNA methylase subunit